MLFLTRWTYSANNDRSREGMKAGLATFGELGPGPGEIAHYIAADGSGGYVISENDSIDEVHERILRYTHMLDFEIVPILTVDQAVPVAMKVFG